MCIRDSLGGDPAYQAALTTAARDSAQLVSDRASYTKAFPGLPGELAKVASENASIKREAARALTDPNAYSPSAAGSRAQHIRALAIVAGDVARVKQVDEDVYKRQSNHVLLQRAGSTRSLALGDTAFNQPAQTGDVLTIPAAPRVNVVGTVVTPGVVALKTDPTLLSACLLYTSRIPQIGRAHV